MTSRIKILLSKTDPDHTHKINPKKLQTFWDKLIDKNVSPEKFKPVACGQPKGQKCRLLVGNLKANQNFSGQADRKKIIWVWSLDLIDLSSTNLELPSQKLTPTIPTRSALKSCRLFGTS